MRSNRRTTISRILAFIILAAMSYSALAQEAVPPGFQAMDNPVDTFIASMERYLEIQPEIKVDEGSWFAIGPFEMEYAGLSGSAEIDTSQTLTLDDATTFSWVALESERDRIVNSETAFPPENNIKKVIYLYRNLSVNHPGIYDLEFRTTWGMRSDLWLNGRQPEKVHRHTYPLDLKKGDNTLLVRIELWHPRGRPIDIRMDWGNYMNLLHRAIANRFPGQRTGFIKEYIDLSAQARSGRPGPDEYANEVLRPEALIQDTDSDALDVVLRRTAALVEHLSRMKNAPDLQSEKAELQELKNEAAAAEDKPLKRLALFPRACALRRNIAFQNPLIDFDDILFLTHHRATANHMCDQYFGFNARPGGSVYRLEDAFSDSPRAIDLMEDSPVQNGRLKGETLKDGSCISLDLDYDAARLAFAWTQAADDGRWTTDTCYQVFTMKPDGSDLRMLTDGQTNDFDPCFKPDGRIAFVSERRGGFGRCHGRPVPTYTVHDMADDGSNIETLSYHETNEWHPSIDNDGMLVYTRWDYVDRDSDVAHHIWISYPDGRDPRSYHGNYPVNRKARPWMEMSLRAIPDTHRYIGVAAPHHGQAYGSLILIDQALPDDNFMSQLKRITPDVRFPESEGGAQAYGTPWPLDQDFYLCVYDSDAQHYGIWLVDSFGNRVEVYTDPKVACLDPIPFKPRKKPPVIPPVRIPEIMEASPDMGEVLIINAYSSDFDWPEGSEIAAIRVVQIFPKSTAHQNNPRIGIGAQSLARGVLGTAPVESDGSAYFRVPVGVPVYFQAIDKQGRAIQSMKSNTYLHKGERLTCLGCHEPKRHTQPDMKGIAIQAIRKGPVDLQPEFAEAYPLSFPRLVQPVLDKHCAPCHQEKEKAPLLSAEKAGKSGWSKGYAALEKFAWAKHGGNGALKKKNKTSRSIPGEVGAQASKLFEMLQKGHHDVKLSDEEMRRITLWLDTNSNFYGAYREEDAQRQGQTVMPLLE